MKDSSDNYDRMPIKRVDLILGQLWPEHWTPERLRGASPTDKREAVRKAFSRRGRRRFRAGRTSRPAYRAVTDPVSKPVSSGGAPPKSDMMSDLSFGGFTIAPEQTDKLSMKVTEGAGYNYGDLDPAIATDAKAAATRIRSLTAEIAEETVRREVQIGRELFAMKAGLGHGHFGPWLAAEFN